MKDRGFILLLLLACAGTSTAAEDAGRRDIPDGARGLETRLAAHVGDGGVGVRELRFYLDRYARENGTAVSKLDAETRRRILETAIEDEMIFQEAMNEGLHREEPFYGKILKLYKADQALEGIRPEAFTKEEVRAVYETRPEDFMKPARYRFSLLVFPRGSKNIPEQAAKAKEDPASVSGWLDGGWVEKETGLGFPLPPEMTAGLFAMKRGEVSGPVQDGLGIHYVFWLTDYKPGEIMPFEEAQPHAVHRLIQEKKKANEIRLAEKLSGEREEEFFFRQALDEGYHRWQMHRALLLDLYARKSGTDRQTLLAALRGKYPVEILKEFV